MVLSMAGKSEDSISKGVAVIGSSVAATQAALTLAQMGIEVKLITNSAVLGWNGAASDILGNSALDQRYLWPLFIRVASHPLITLYSSAEADYIEGEKGNFKIQVLQHPRYINEELCTACGRCEAECSAVVTSLLRGQKIRHSAIHKPLLGAKTVPSAYVIDKNGFAPCQVACPLGINVQGFISLMSKGKTDKALALINEAAPLGGILGRVCGHPCEDNCNRAQVDSPVSIRALHRYAADNAPGGIVYGRKFPARSREGRIAIVGSGPAGLAAAWELTRRGYSPTVFESHGVIGGMLATGIPRFRLPREVREREMEAIKDLGVDIRTGITLGRDVTFAYLKERGYRAFFLAIGAQKNTKLNIPGEELDGVVDCMSLLLALNLKVDIFVGLNVAVIGGGNAAIDTARSAFRSGAKEVTVFYRRTRAEMTANFEEVEEAIKEGVKIEYLTVPVEILGDGGKVTGIHCQRTKLSEKVMADGRHRPEPISGSDFVMDADHVIIAVGQSPDASQLNMEGLAIDTNTGVIQANPLTLETGIPGVFAGGDCVTGPNNVVEAVATGLRAAESIDRYLQGHDLETGRSLEPPATAEIDMETIEVSPYKRASMPVIPLRKRINSFEETTTGLSAEAAQMETQRCLNCALCSQCLECTAVCELGAVFHDDAIRHFEVGAEVVLRFPSRDLVDKAPADNAGQETPTEGVHIVSSDDGSETISQLIKAMAVALESTIELKPNKVPKNWDQDSTEMDTDLQPSHRVSEQPADSTRLGVFLCRCGGSISSVIDFGTVTRKLSNLTGITHIYEIAQACTEAGAKQIASHVVDRQLDRVVLAACRCCNSEQVCYSCTDRRMMCQQYLSQHLVLPHNAIVEFCNIREQCAWVHQDDPKGATRKAVQIISSGVARAQIVPLISLRKESILPSVLILGGGLVSVTTARGLASRGYQVNLVTRQGTQEGQQRYDETIPLMLEQTHEKNLTVKPWPRSLKLHGSPGNYETVLKYGPQSDRIRTGALLVDMEGLNNGEPPILDTSSGGGLLGRIVSRRKNPVFSPTTGGDLRQEITIGETAGIFMLPHDSADLPDDQVLLGLATSARVSAYLEQGSIIPRILAVNIDSKMCRGCGDCTVICPYIEMRERQDGTLYAYVDNALCLGCGACITSCPTGAITQPLQSDKQIISTLRSILNPSRILSEV